MNQDNAHHEHDQVNADNTIVLESKVAKKHVQARTDAEPSSFHAQKALVADAEGGSTVVDQAVSKQVSAEGAALQKEGIAVATPAAVVSEPTSLAPVQVRALLLTNA